MSQKRFDIQFSSDRWISTVLGIMLFLAGMSFFAGLGLNKYVMGWSETMNATFTVQVPQDKKKELELEKVLTRINNYTGVKKAKFVDASHIENMLNELGMESTAPSFYVDVSLHDEDLSHFNFEAFKQEVEKIGQPIFIEKPTPPSDDTIALTKLLQKLSLSFSMILLISILLTTGITIYAEIQTHQHTINILSLIGAPNTYISKLFQKYTSSFTTKAILLSVALECFAFAFLYFSYSEKGLTISGLIAWQGALYVLICIPLVVFLLTFLITPAAVIFSLKKQHKNAYQV